MVKKMTLMGLVLAAFLFLPFQAKAQEGQDVKAEETIPAQVSEDVKTEEIKPAEVSQEVKSEEVKPVEVTPVVKTEETKEEAKEISSAGTLMGSFTIGEAVVDMGQRSAKAGEYSGLDNDMTYPVGEADLSYNNASMYLDFRGSNLGLENRNAYIESGRYGKYNIYLEHDEAIHLISNNARTPFDGTGSANLTLPAGFVKGSSTSAMTNLSANTKYVDLSLERKAGTAGFSVALGRDITFKGSYKREEKDGTKQLGGTIGFLGAAILPEPVDYTTDELRTTLAYNGKAAQAEIAYHLSTFTDNNDSLSWDNPFNNNPTTGKNSLPPDNRYQKISLSGGANLPYSSRISAVAEYGEMKQDEALLPYSNNASTVISAPLPVASADAKISTTHLMLNLASKPISRLSLDAKYRYYKTKNETPMNLFQYVTVDGSSQPSTSGANAVYNLPYDYVQNQFKMDASYYIFRGTALKAGYDRDIIGRDYREVAKTTEDSYKVRLSSRAIPSAFVSADYSQSQRRIDGAYDASRVYDSMHTSGYIASPDSQGFSNNPELKMFDVAERDRQKYGAKISLFGAQDTSIGVAVNSQVDNYDTTLGLKDSSNTSYTLDFSMSPAEAVTVYTFYTKEKISYDIAGRQFTTGTSSWSADNENDINTAGIGTTVDFMEKALTIAADYSYSESTGSIKLTSGSSIPVAMPNQKTYLQRLKANGKYRINENMTAGIGYEIESYSSDDWSTDGIAPASSAVSNILTLTGSAGDYFAQKGTMYLSYNF